MKALGIVALVLSVVSIFIPIFGTLLIGLSGFFAILASHEGKTLSIAAVIINITNLFILTPSLTIAFLDETGDPDAIRLKLFFFVLLGIQFVAIVAFIATAIFCKDND